SKHPETRESPETVEEAPERLESRSAAAGGQEGAQSCFGKQFWINILLTLLGYIPGIVHAVWVIAKY
ncbi:MAG TPA: YqaE/Pmp3 family membrane protein, partial [Rubrobacter sp.]|nr:YqaE/Pmp3 family membrane protein [Rubrobacter sp.]